MPEYTRQDLKRRFENAYGKLRPYVLASNRSIYETDAACCVINMQTGNYYTKKNGSIGFFTASSGSGGCFGTYRSWINSHSKLKCVGGRYRSSDAELKILDQLMEIPKRFWRNNNLIVIKVSQEPCRACKEAVRKFCRDNNDTNCYIALRWPGEGNLRFFGKISASEEEIH